MINDVLQTTKFGRNLNHASSKWRKEGNVCCSQFTLRKEAYLRTTPLPVSSNKLSRKITKPRKLTSKLWSRASRLSSWRRLSGLVLKMWHMRLSHVWLKTGKGFSPKYWSFWRPQAIDISCKRTRVASLIAYNTTESIMPLTSNKLPLNIRGQSSSRRRNPMSTLGQGF